MGFIRIRWAKSEEYVELTELTCVYCSETFKQTDPEVLVIPEGWVLDGKIGAICPTCSYVSYI